MLFALGFVIELPWNLGLPRDTMVPVWMEGDRNERAVPSVLGDPPFEDAYAAGWLRFRTVQVATQRPLAASDLAFGIWMLRPPPGPDGDGSGAPSPRDSS